MSRAPTPKEAAPAVTWFDAAKEYPRGQIVLTTTDPLNDNAGVPGRWYQRRQFLEGRWTRVEQWVDPVSLVPLDPQPTFWRPETNKSDWRPDLEAFAKKAPAA